jgi:putative transposase
MLSWLTDGMPSPFKRPLICSGLQHRSSFSSTTSQVSTDTTRRKLFPSDESALKVIYLATSQAAQKWTMPIQNWRLALNRFMIEFGERIEKYAH